MDAEIKRTIDLRLAKGEINQSEYASLVQQLSNASGSPPDADTSVLIEVSRSLSIYATYLTHDKRVFQLNQIAGLSYSTYRQVVNFVPVTIMSSLTIYLSDGSKVSADSNSALFRTKKGKRIEEAYVYLRGVTHQRRLNDYLSKFDDLGYIDINGARIFRDGSVHKDELVLSIQECNSAGTFWIGAESGIGRATAYDPNQVILQDPSCKSMNKRRILFYIDRDYDVIERLLMHLARSGNIGL